MSEPEQQMEQTKQLIAGAREAVESLPSDQSASDPTGLKRLNEALDFAEQVVGRVRPTLVPDGAWTNLDNQLNTISTQVQQNSAAFVSQLAAHSSNVLTYLAPFLLVGKRPTEQAATGLISEVRSAAEAELSQLRTEIAEANEQQQALQEQLNERSQQLEGEIEARKGELDQAVAELRSSVTAERQRIEQTATDQSERFRKEQQEREEQFTETQQQFESKLGEIEQTATERSQELLTSIEEMRRESAELVGAIGVTGTAERYKSEADDQKKIADTWRLVAVGVAVLAVGIGVWAALTAEQGEALALVGKLAIGLAVGALATYAAKQSARHRDREEDAKAVQLDLAAFNVFIEPLPEEEQAKERAELGRRLFGRRFANRPAAVEEGGPGLLGHATDLLRRGDSLPPEA